MNNRLKITIIALSHVSVSKKEKTDTKTSYINGHRSEYKFLNNNIYNNNKWYPIAFYIKKLDMCVKSISTVKIYISYTSVIRL